MLRNALAALALLCALAPLGACHVPCNEEQICTLVGGPAGDPNQEICDGKSFYPCDYSITGRRIHCTKPGSTTPKYAVCTPSGWTFDNK